MPDLIQCFETPPTPAPKQVLPTETQTQNNQIESLPFRATPVSPNQPIRTPSNNNQELKFQVVHTNAPTPMTEAALLDLELRMSIKDGMKLSKAIEEEEEEEGTGPVNTTSPEDKNDLPGNDLDDDMDNEQHNAFETKLREGIQLIKHGRRGNPHPRVIFADMKLERVYWQKLGTKELKGNVDQSIVLKDVTSVVTGRNTEVLKRSGVNSKFYHYVSLIAGDRTLDIEAKSVDEAKSLIRGFQHLISPRVD